MSQVPKKLCADSLRWIVNFRQLRATNPAWTLDQVKHKADELDGHTAGTLLWTVKNSTYIDEHGWDKWFKTPAAAGYAIPVFKHPTLI